MAKPTGAVVVNSGNALVRNPVSIVPFTEGVGTARDIVTGRGFPVFWTTNSAGNAAAVGFGAAGGGGIPGLAIGTHGVDNLSLPTGVCTIAFVRRKTDATARYAETVSMLTGINGDQLDPGNQLTPSMIRIINGPNSDNHVYWFYGSNGVASPAGAYTASTNTEAWVFVAGATAMNVYKDSSSTIATTAAVAARTNNPLNQMNLSLNSVTGDNQELNFFAVLGTEWSSAEVATWLANPYQLITAGTPTPIPLQDPAAVQNFVSPYPYVTTGTAGATTQLGGIYRIVHSGDNLQTALNAMLTGDVLVIDAGASFNGGTHGTTLSSFVLPVVNTQASGWCAILSSNDALLPGGPVPGQRVEPVDAVNMPKILTTIPTGGGGPPLLAPSYAEQDGNGVFGPTHGWIIRGIEFSPDGANATEPTFNTGIVINGNYYGANPTLVDRRFIIDRCYIHSRYANPSQNNIRTGIGVAGGDIRICGNYITDIQAQGQDTYCIGINNSPGTILIENNFFAGTAGGVFVGGSYPSDAAGSLVNDVGDLYSPHDVIIRGNYFTKLQRWQGNTAFVVPTSEQFNNPLWDGANWDVKASLEFKEGIRILIEANTFDNHFFGVIPFAAIAIDAWNQGSADFPTSGAEDASFDTAAKLTDVMMRYNRFRKGCSSALLMYSGNRPEYRRAFLHNLAWCAGIVAGEQALGVTRGSAFSIAPVSTNGFTDFRFEHNTMISNINSGSLGGTCQRVRMANSIVGYGHFGVHEENETFGGASIAVDAIFDHWVGDRVVLQYAMVDFGDVSGLGGRQPAYSTANWGPGAAGVADGQYIIAGLPAACGIDADTGRLLPGSTLAGIATDGGDLGVDWRYITNPATRYPATTARPATTSRPAATLIPQGT